MSAAFYGHDARGETYHVVTLPDHAAPEDMVAEYASLFPDTIYFTMPLCTYGGDCPEPAQYVLTRDNAWTRQGEPQTCYACRTHRDPLTESLARYVEGWGRVTFTIDRLPNPVD